MSFPVAAVPATTNPWALDFVSGSALDGPFILYNLPTGPAAQVGAVALLLEYGEEAFTTDVYVLRLHAQNGDVMFTQASGVFDAAMTSDGVIEATWAIGASDAAQFPALVLASFEPTVFGAYSTVPLPNMALPSASYVSLTAIRGLGMADSHAVNISGLVTYTPGGGGVTSQSTVVPFLVPQG